LSLFFFFSWNYLSFRTLPFLFFMCLLRREALRKRFRPFVLNFFLFSVLSPYLIVVSVFFSPSFFPDPQRQDRPLLFPPEDPPPSTPPCIPGACRDDIARRPGQPFSSCIPFPPDPPRRCPPLVPPSQNAVVPTVVTLVFFFCPPGRESSFPRSSKILSFSLAFPPPAFWRPSVRTPHLFKEPHPFAGPPGMSF